MQKARLIASKAILEAIQQELIRILNIRGCIAKTHSSPWDQVTMELAGINSELTH